MVHAMARGRSSGIGKAGGSFSTGASDPVEIKIKINRLKYENRKHFFSKSKRTVYAKTWTNSKVLLAKITLQQTTSNAKIFGVWKNFITLTRYATKL